MTSHIHTIGPVIYKHAHRGGGSGRFGWPDHHHTVEHVLKTGKKVYEPAYDFWKKERRA